MVKQSLFTNLNRVKKDLCVLIFLSLASSGCQANEHNTETFSPLINGLSAGYYSKETGCVTVGNLSAKLELDEFEQDLHVFDSANCKNSSLLYKKKLSIESQIAGIWNRHIVIDEGTDANGRELHLLSSTDKNIAHKFYYALMPEFKATTLVFMMPLDTPAKPEQCASDQKESLKEWKRLGFELELAEERTFDVTKGTTSIGSKRLCFPLQ